MSNIEGLAGRAAVVAAGVILAGIVMYMFRGFTPIQYASAGYSGV